MARFAPPTVSSGVSADQEADQRGLAAAVRPDDAESIAPHDADGKVPHDGARPEAFADTLRFDHQRARLLGLGGADRRLGRRRDGGLWPGRSCSAARRRTLRLRRAVTP